MVKTFNLEKVKDLSFSKQKKYITKYFVPLSDGNHAQKVNGLYVVKDESQIKNAYFNRTPKELCTYYFREYCGVKEISYKLNKPEFFDDKIN